MSKTVFDRGSGGATAAQAVAATYWNMESITFVLDGSNLAALDKSKGHSLETIEAIRAALRRAYPGCKLVTLVDASLRHRVERTQFDEQESKGILFSAPADEDADYFILSFARRRGAVVVTTDRYIGQAQRLGVPLLRPMLADGEVFLGEPRVFRNVRGRRSEPFDLRELAKAASHRSEIAQPNPEPEPAPEPSETSSRGGKRPESGPERRVAPDRSRPSGTPAPAAAADNRRSARTRAPRRSARGKSRTTAQPVPREPASGSEVPSLATEKTRTSGPAISAGRTLEAPLPWRDAVVPAVRKLRRTFGLKSPRGRSRLEIGKEARTRRYAWLQDVLHAARHVGLGDETHRRLLLAGLPRAWLLHLPDQYPPDEQLAFDVCVLAHLPRASDEALLPLSLWLRNAHVLVHPLRLASFFQGAVDVHEAKGAMPLSWLPFPDTPYEIVDRVAYRSAQERRARGGGAVHGNVRKDLAPGPSPEPLRADAPPSLGESNQGVQPADGNEGKGTVLEVCPYCGSRSLPVYDFYTGRSCIRCFIEREEALQEKLGREQSHEDPWSRNHT